MHTILALLVYLNADSVQVLIALLFATVLIGALGVLLLLLRWYSIVVAWKDS